MNYPIPLNAEELLALRNYAIDEEIIATAIAGIIKIARREGKSLEELQAGVLQDDRVLDMTRRQWLSEAIALAWKLLP